MKDYKKILESVVNIINTTEKTDIGFTNICSYIGENCPELKESKDERIRKEILDYIDKSTGCKRWVAWLEKQGEQKPTNKVEPKFKVGDYVVDNCGDVWRIEGIINQFYILEGIDGGESQPTIEWVNKTCHLWTISDAKDGDVLAVTIYPEGTWIGIFKEQNGCTFSTYCFLNTVGTFKRGTYSHGNGKSIHPATKEQRDKFEKAMAESGYEFDFDKKELKEIENEEYDGKDYGIDGLWHAKNILEKTLGKVDGYQTDDGILDHKCAISFIDKLYKQKPAEWSEEDEKMFEYTLDMIEWYNGKNENKSRLVSDWLKSLKDRLLEKSIK